VHGLAGSNTEQDSQYFEIRHLLSECRIETGAALLNKSEMEARRKGNRLEARADAPRKIVTNGTAVGVGIGSWNGGMFAYIQAGDA
jgi:hypothetical protein